MVVFCIGQRVQTTIDIAKKEMVFECSHWSIEKGTAITPDWIGLLKRTKPKIRLTENEAKALHIQYQNEFMTISHEAKKLVLLALRERTTSGEGHHTTNTSQATG